MRKLGIAIVFLWTIAFCHYKVFAQEKAHEFLFYEKPGISGGAEYSSLLQRAINFGAASKFRVKSQVMLNKGGERLGATASITPIYGVDFDTDASTTGYYHIPPDPSGVAGQSYLVGVNNTSIRWSDKTGGSVVTKRLGKNATTASGSFFETLSPVNGTFDPKVIYDQYEGRFIVITLEKQDKNDGDSENSSRILIAVSASDDPNGTWYFTEIDSKINVSGTDTWADYPGLGLNSDAILITANLFTYGATHTYSGSRLWVIEKSPFYTGGTAVVHIYDPAGSAGTSSTTMQPAHMFGSEPTNLKAYLVRYSGFTDGTNEAISVIEFTETYSSPTFTNYYVSLSDIDNTSASMPDAPQSGTSTLIETNDRRALNAVWRDNYLYTAFTIVPGSGTDSAQATAHWVKCSASLAGGLALSDQGNCGGEDIATGAYTFFPSVAVNSTGQMVVGFSASASSIYCGAYYAGRVSTDPAGTTPHTGTLKAGEDYYVRTFGGARNRWGDYTGISVDPSDDKTFWLFNEYAQTRGTSFGGEDGRWGTVFGKIVDSPFPVELSGFSANVDNSKIKLNWRTETEENNYGFKIERKMSDSEQSGWKEIGFVKGAGNSNSPKDYSFTDKVNASGKYLYRLKQIDLDGSFADSDIVEVSVTLPSKFALLQNYPNPFNPSTTISYSLPARWGKKGVEVLLNVYNAVGEKVATLVKERQSAGNYSVVFDASNLASGVYYYTLRAGDFVATRKMILIK